MNGLERITERIESDAAAAAARRLEAAREECEKLAAQAEQTAQERYWAGVRSGVKTVEERSQRLARAAEAEAKKTILAFKQETVDEVFDEVQRRLLALPEEEYLAFLCAQATEGLKSGDEEIVLNARDSELYGPRLLALLTEKLEAHGITASLRLSEEPGEFRGGLLVRRGNVTGNGTVEALVGLARQEMRMEVGEILFS